MSSLAAARADNFYYPPEWRPEYGGISKFQGSKGKNQYEQYGIIRFELPFDAWCLGCKRHMCKGLRFNAKKDKDGKYFSTQIFSFSMKCHSCEQRFKIRTDPKNRTYEFVEGIQKMEQDFVPDSTDSILHVLTDEERMKLSKDKFFKLEHELEDKTKAASANESITSLLQLSTVNSKNDFDRNSALRKRLRTEKKDHHQKLEAGRRMGLGDIPLVDEHPEDLFEALTHPTLHSHSQKRALQSQERSSLSSLLSQPILPSYTSSSHSSSMTKIHNSINNMKKLKESVEGEEEGKEVGKEGRIKKKSDRERENRRKILSHPSLLPSLLPSHPSLSLVSSSPTPINTSPSSSHPPPTPSTSISTSSSFSSSSSSSSSCPSVSSLLSLYGDDSEEAEEEGERVEGKEIGAREG